MRNNNSVYTTVIEIKVNCTITIDRYNIKYQLSILRIMR